MPALGTWGNREPLVRAALLVLSDFRRNRSPNRRRGQLDAVDRADLVDQTIDRANPVAQTIDWANPVDQTGDGANPVDRRTAVRAAGDDLGHGHRSDPPGMPPGEEARGHAGRL